MHFDVIKLQKEFNLKKRYFEQELSIKDRAETEQKKKRSKKKFTLT